MADELVRAGELQPVWRLIGELATTRSSAECVQRVVDALVTVGGYSGAAVSVLAPDGSIVPLAAAGLPIDRARLAQRTVEPRSAARTRGGARVRRGRRPAVGLMRQPRPVSELCGSHELHGRAGDLVGMLVLAGRDDAASPSPSPLQRELLPALIAQAGAALEDARRARQDRREQDRLLQAERALRVAFDEAPLGTALISLDRTELGRFVRVNDALCRLSLYSTHQLTAMSTLDLVHPDERDRIEANLRRAMDGRRTPFRAQRRLLQATGESIWVQVTISPVLDEDGVPRHAVTHLEPLHARGTPEREHDARHDPRTGLLNPAALREELAEAMARVRRHGTSGAVLLCDLGDLANIADQPARDRALAALTDSLGRVLRDSDVRGHLDENRLLVGIEEIDAADTAALADRIIAALSYSEAGDENSDENSGRAGVEIRASIGIAPFTPGSSDVDTVLEQARDASRRARARGPGTRVLWDRADDAPPQPPGRTTHSLYRRTEHPD